MNRKRIWKGEFVEYWASTENLTNGSKRPTEEGGAHTHLDRPPADTRSMKTHSCSFLSASKTSANLMKKMALHSNLLCRPDNPSSFAALCLLLPHNWAPASFVCSAAAGTCQQLRCISQTQAWTPCLYHFAYSLDDGKCTACRCFSGGIIMG